MTLIIVEIHGDRADLEEMVCFLLNTEIFKGFPKPVHTGKYYPRDGNSPLLGHIDFLIAERVAQDATLNPELPHLPLNS